ncbi:MAG: CinA family protein [Dehalococcoidia bacterium]
MTTLEHTLGELLKRRGLMLAVAESATGGRIADRLTNVSGSSAYFLGGVVAYDNQAKVRLLGVAQETLERFGAVSPETAQEMAQGVRTLFAAEVGLSSTGIAGPTGATPQKPVGLVFIGVASPRGVHAQQFLCQGSREENKEAFTQAALTLLREELEKWSSGG